MSYEESLRSITLHADSTLAVYTGVPGLPGSAVPNVGNQYRFVSVSGANTVGLTGAGADAVGVVQNKPQVDDAAATVAISGVSNVVVGAGGVTVGSYVESDADGKAVDAAGGEQLGVALQTATAGEIVPVLLRMN